MYHCNGIESADSTAVVIPMRLLRSFVRVEPENRTEDFMYIGGGLLTLLIIIIILILIF